MFYASLYTVTSCLHGEEQNHILNRVKRNILTSLDLEEPPTAHTGSLPASLQYTSLIHTNNSIIDGPDIISESELLLTATKGRLLHLIYQLVFRRSGTCICLCFCPGIERIEPWNNMPRLSLRVCKNILKRIVTTSKVDVGYSTTQKMKRGVCFHVTKNWLSIGDLVNMGDLVHAPFLNAG